MLSRVLAIAAVLSGGSAQLLHFMAFDEQHLPYYEGCIAANRDMVPRIWTERGVHKLLARDFQRFTRAWENLSGYGWQSSVSLVIDSRPHTP